MNYVKLEGNLGQVPTLRQTPNGHDVSNCSIATKFSKDNQEYTTWHRITAWGETAKNLANCGQGDKVQVEGYIAYREWEGKDGVKHRDAEITVKTVNLLFKKGSGKKNTERGTDNGSESPY